MPSFLREPLVIIEDALSVDVCEELKYIGTHSENQYGQVGDGTTSNRLLPTLISGEHVWKAISTGGYHACGLTAGGGAYCWGRDNYGQLGNGLALDSRVPTKIFMPN